MNDQYRNSGIAWKRIYDEAWAKQDACDHKWEYSTSNSNCLDCAGHIIPCDFHKEPYLRCNLCDTTKGQWDARKALTMGPLLSHDRSTQKET